MVFYHASKFDYEFPVYEDLIKNRTNHANGNLGLWFATEDKWIDSFGDITYKVEVNDSDIKTISVSELFKWEKDSKSHSLTEEEHANYYTNLREKLLNDYKVVMFKENNNEISMGIILDLNCIKSFSKKISSENEIVVKNKKNVI